MTDITMFAIRHTPSGGYLPIPQGRNGRGGSHTEPVVFKKQQGTKRAALMPRLWATEAAAKIALTTWLKGKVTAHRWSGQNYAGEYDYDEELEIIPCLHRNREDMEIVPVIIKLP